MGSLEQGLFRIIKGHLNMIAMIHTLLNVHSYEVDSVRVVVSLLISLRCNGKQTSVNFTYTIGFM